MNHMNHFSNRTNGRIAGFLFLGLVITGMFAEFYVRRGLYSYHDPAATFSNIQTAPALFGVGILSDLIMSTLFLFFGLVLYHVFRPVNTGQSLLMLITVTVSVGIMCLNLINMVAVLLITQGATDYLSSFSVEQLQGFTTFFMKMHGHGYKIAQIFYGLCLFPLGYLVARTRWAPPIIGYVLMLGCVVDQVDVVRYFVFSSYESVILDHITAPANLGEFSFSLWLMILGLKNQNTPSSEISKL